MAKNYDLLAEVSVGLKAWYGLPGVLMVGMIGLGWLAREKDYASAYMEVLPRVTSIFTVAKRVF